MSVDSLMTIPEDEVNRCSRTVEVIKERASNYDSYDQVRNNYRGLVELTKNLKFEMDPRLLEGLSAEMRLHLQGKRMLDILEKFIRTDEVLGCVVADDVDVAALRGVSFGDTIVIGSAEVKEPDPVRLDPVFLEVMDLSKEQELRQVKIFLCGLLEGHLDNTAEHLQEVHHRYLTSSGAYRTSVLRGGLVENGALKGSVIDGFNKCQEVMNQARTLVERAAAKKKLEALEEQYCQEIWELEDAMPLYTYLHVAPVTDANKDEALLEINAQLEGKWVARKLLAARVIGKQRGVKGMAEREVMSAFKREGLGGEIVVGVQNVIAGICGKVSAVQSVELRRVLNTPINDDRRRSRTMCLDRGDLAGIMKILEKNYRHAPVTMMFSSLRELFEAEVKGGPQRIMEWINSRVSIWTEFQFFEYLTPDMLFTFCLIYRLRGSNVGMRAFQDVVTFMRNDESGYSPEGLRGAKSMNSEMVLKQLVANVIRDDASRNTFGGHEKGRVVAKAPDVIQAHVAEGEKKEIMREMNEWVELGGRKFPYTSTLVQCQKCLDGNDPHTPVCYLGSCHKCKSYGHKSVACRTQK